MAFLVSAVSVVISAVVIQESSALAVKFPNRFNNNASGLPPVFNINCGGRPSHRFLSDEDSWIQGETSSFEMPKAVIGGAEKKNLPMYKSFRYGVSGDEWGYDIPVSQPGIYACTVHFAETLSEAFFIGARVFDLTVAADGSPVIFKGIDVFRVLSGARFTVYTRTAVSLYVTKGISLRVVKSAGSKLPPFMSGITCERMHSPVAHEPVKQPTSPKPPSVTTKDGRSSPRRKHQSATGIVAACVAGVLAMAAAAFYFWTRRTNRNLLHAIELGAFHIPYFSSPQPSTANMEIDQHPVDSTMSENSIEIWQ